MTLAGSALRIHATFLLYCGLSTVGVAAEPEPACLPYAEIGQRLARDYSEAPVSYGISNQGMMVTLFMSRDDRSWTLVGTAPPPAKACVIANGRNWDVAPPLPAHRKDT